MKINYFLSIDKTRIGELDNNNRTINYGKFDNVLFTGRNLHYPNALMLINNSLISPYDEKIMSLNKESFYENNEYFSSDECNFSSDECLESVFFFIYNLDNYYHFIYDTLPYLHTFFWIKQNCCPNIKILLNTSHSSKTSLYQFNVEFLNKYINFETECIFVKKNTIYKNVFVSSSLTHSGMSNAPPRKEIYNIFSHLSLHSTDKNKIYPYIYISRRTWCHNDTSNIGTNYTTRRKMVNEDILVSKLEELGFKEIFAEKLTTDEKISIFKNAKIIIGSIGGGMCNLLFSPSTVHSIVIVTPFFLDINYRFKYSLEHTKLNYFTECETYNDNPEAYPLFCRVIINDTDVIGEIIDYNPITKYYNIQCSNNDVVGFNLNIKFEKKQYYSYEFTLLDKGLNSMFSVNIDSLLLLCKNIIRNI
jgi:hypothetical protein